MKSLVQRVAVVVVVLSCLVGVIGVLMLIPSGTPGQFVAGLSLVMASLFCILNAGGVYLVAEMYDVLVTMSHDLRQEQKRAQSRDRERDRRELEELLRSRHSEFDLTDEEMRQYGLSNAQ